MSRAGFTLIELMVGLLIFSLLSAGSIALLSFSVTTRERMATRLDDMAEITRLRAMLGADLMQAAPRLPRDANGLVLPAFRAREGTLLFGLVRRGWANDDDLPRASLQRVDYLLENDRLLRQSHPAVDGSEPAATALLLEGVTSVRLRYRMDGAWQDRWDDRRPDALPQAVEIVVGRPNMGDLRQIFLVGTDLP